MAQDHFMPAQDRNTTSGSETEKLGGSEQTGARADCSLDHLHRLASVGTLSAGIAHEIKNALVPVKTFVELLTQQYPDAELAPLVNRELNRINSLVCQILKCAGPAKPMFAPVHLHQVLEHCLRLVETQLKGKRVKLEQCFAAKLDLVHGDAYQLEQAITNILLNALEAMETGGLLTVHTEAIPAKAATLALTEWADQPLVRVEIRDTGVGIAPENVERLFDTFFTTKKSGTGLGLTITRRIIDEHSGIIRVDSEPGKGTTFSIVLPVAQAQPC